MSRSNDVFQVLVTKGNQAPLAPDLTVADLAPGQSGVFDFKTNLSIDDSATVRNFYIAVGLDLNGDGITDDVSKSRGSHIQSKETVYYNYRPHTAGQPLKVVLKDYTAQCSTEYGIKLELRNQEIYRTQGYNQFSKTFSIVTSCCDGCTPTCPSGDANEITKLLKINIQNESSNLITAEAIARDVIVSAAVGTAVDYAIGDVVTDADLEAIMAFNAAQADSDLYLYTDLEVTTVTQGLQAFCNVNLQYFYPRETIAIMSKSGGALSGFDCTGAIEVTQQATFEEGSGYDVKQQEYLTKGWSEGPYRLSTLNGVENVTNFNAETNVKYDQIALAYDQISRNAWLKYSNDEATCIAIPAVDTVTRDGLLTILDAIAGVPNGFDAKADDALAADVDPLIIEKTEDKTVDTDGLD